MEGAEFAVLEDLYSDGTCSLEVWNLNVETHWHRKHSVQAQADQERKLSEICHLEKFHQV